MGSANPVLPEWAGGVHLTVRALGGRWLTVPMEPVREGKVGVLGSTVRCWETDTENHYDPDSRLEAKWREIKTFWCVFLEVE